MPRKPQDPLIRFYRLADTSGGPDACWPWRGYLAPTGYGQFKWRKSNQEMAHRAAYRLFFGEIPEGAHVDHECHNADLSCAGGRSCPHRSCVNPAHLAAKTPGANLKASAHTLAGANVRKTHCPQDHPYDEANTYVIPRGGRDCRTCRNEATARSRKKAAT